MRFVTPILFAMWGAIELFRLRLGASGNLRERVPELAAFLLLTAFPALPLVGFLCFGALQRLPMETALGMPMVVFLVLEIVVALRTVRAFIAQQTAQFFRLCQERDVPQGGDGADEPPFAVPLGARGGAPPPLGAVEAGSWAGAGAVTGAGAAPGPAVSDEGALRRRGSRARVGVAPAPAPAPEAVSDVTMGQLAALGVQGLRAGVREWTGDAR
jgi:hypothetical protein